MLPDLPDLKADIQRIFDRYVHLLARRKMGIFSDLDKHTIHEGRHLFVQRADGSTSRSGLESSSGEVEIKVSDDPEDMIRRRHAVLEDLANQLASRMSARLYQRLGEELDAAGQTVGTGKPFGVDTILEAFEKIELDFDTDAPSDLRMAIPPGLREVADAAFEKLNTDPELRARGEALMQKKRRSWRDREAARKLVG